MPKRTSSMNDGGRCFRRWLLLSSLVIGHWSLLHAQQRIKAQTPVVLAPLPEEQLTDAELVQQLLSNFLASAEIEQFKDQRKEMDIIIGDMRRVVGLPPERLRLLEIAAKGAVDRSLEGWRSAEENQARQQASGLPPDMVQQRLAGLGSMRVGNDSADRNGVWTTSIDQVLTPEEHAKWQQAENDRKAYRTRALAQMMVAELDRQTSLSLTQCEKLEPLAQKALEDYLPDMSNYTDRNSGIDFRMLLLMLSGAPTPEVQAVLTPDQYAKWQQLTADYRGWWQSIEQNHRSRMNSNGNDPKQQQGNAQLRKGAGIIIRGGGNIILK